MQYLLRYFRRNIGDIFLKLLATSRFYVHIQYFVQSSSLQLAIIHSTGRFPRQIYLLYIFHILVRHRFAIYLPLSAVTSTADKFLPREDSSVIPRASKTIARHADASSRKRDALIVLEQKQWRGELI